MLSDLKEQSSFNFMAAITVHSDFGVQENKGASTFSPSICHEVMGLDAIILAFSLLCHFHQEALQFLFSFSHKGGIICISEVIDISPSNLDSSLILCFIQPHISHDVLCI